MTDRCTLRYRIDGADSSKDARQSLAWELQDALPHCESITALPIVDGLEVILEFSSIEPFGRDAFEPYVLEQVLAPTAESACRRSESTLGFQLLSETYRSTAG